MKSHGPFKHSPYRHPADTGTLHGTLFSTFRDHKVVKCDQLFGKNPEFMLDFFSVRTQNTAKNTIFVYVKTADYLHRSIFYWDTKPVGHMRTGKSYDLIFTTKTGEVLTFLFTRREKSVFLYTFADKSTLGTMPGA